MPFIVRWPGHIPSGRIDEKSILSANDLLPSLCALAGARIPVGFAIDGKNRSDVLLGKPSSESRTLYWEYGRNEVAFKFPEGKDRSPNLAIREGKWKFFINFDGTGAELYNMEIDEKETTNLVSSNPKEAERLKAKLLSWRKGLPVAK